MYVKFEIKYPEYHILNGKEVNELTEIFDKLNIK